MITLYIKTHNITGLKYFGKTYYNINSEKFKKYKGSGIYWNRHLKVHGDDVTTEIYAQFDETNENEYQKLIETSLNFSKENYIVNSKEWANLQIENGIDGAPVGNIISEETKEKIKISNTGKKHSDETKEKMSNQRQGENHWNYKNITSDETKEKIKYTTRKSCEKYKGLNNPMHTHNIDFSGEKNPNFGNKWTGEMKLNLSKKKKLNYDKNKHPSLSHIKIFNNEDELMFDCFGTFKQTCEDNNLPFSAFRWSYQSNGKGIHLNKKESGFTGWYAIKISKINEK